MLWVCENNQYGMGTAVDRASAVTEIRQKAEGYGMKNGQVDGMDVMKVYDAAKEALEFVRKKSQPYLLEIDTYRFRGHSMGDPERYRKAGRSQEVAGERPDRNFQQAIAWRRKLPPQKLWMKSKRARKRKL